MGLLSSTQYTGAEQMANEMKKHVIVAIAASQGISVADLCRRARVHKTVFHRVLKGERTSARVDAYIARALGVRISTIRRLNVRG